MKTKNWRLETDDNRIAWLYFDAAGSGTNVLSSGVLKELDRMVDKVTKGSPKGLVILSAKKIGFIAGADINEFTTLKDPAESFTLVRRGQMIFDRIEALPFPTVSMIHGFCLGGGLELALACKYRVASDDRKTSLGLPEVKLGIHPGFGGTVRLPRLLGCTAAMEMILTGRSVDAKKARRLGLVDFVVPERHLETRARMCIITPPVRPTLPFRKRIASNVLPRPFLKGMFHRMTEKAAPRAHYPAPHAVVDLWAKHWGRPGVMMEEEAKSVAGLVTGDTAQNLIRLFFLGERLKGLGKGGSSGVHHVHVIGAGVMGGDIASWCVLKGFKVTLQDREPKFIAPAVKRAHELFKKKLKRRALIQQAMDRLIPDAGGRIGLARADIVIEAIFEDPEIKEKLYKEIEPVMKPAAILATNTSSIPIEKLGRALKRPERLAGMHFFNPVAKMPLVEVVSGAATDPTVAQRVAAFTGQIGRLPLPVASGPGFLVNRVLMPYLLEAVLMVEEGVSPETVDRAAVSFGMPMGPIELADLVGLDVCLHVAEVISGDLNLKVPEKLCKMAESGELGKKSGQGFYRYEKGKKAASADRKDSCNLEELTERLILSVINESVACLDEGVVADANLLDAGVVFGTGFAPFRGGPMHFVKSEGMFRIVEKLKRLEKLHGERFRPHEGWKELISGKAPERARASNEG